MRLTDIKIGKKLLLPLVLSTIAIVGVGTLGAVELDSFSSTAAELARRSSGALALARVARNVELAEVYAYGALMADPDGLIGKQAAKDFRPTIDLAHTLFVDAAQMLPEEAAKIRALEARLSTSERDLTRAFDIGQRTPGLSRGAALTADDLRLMAEGGRVMETAGTSIDQVGDDVTALYRSLIAENQRRSEQLKTSSLETIVEIAVGGLLSALGSAAFALWLSSSKVAKPLSGLAEGMRRLATGDANVTVDGSDRQDEVGAMARAVQIFKTNAIEKVRLEADAAEARRAKEEETAREDARKSEEAKRQAHVVETIANGLDLLSNGRLTHRIDEAFPSAYERLRTDFNAAIHKMQETVSLVTTNANAISAGTKEISAASDDLARRTEQQAASLEETAAALKQITERVRKTADGSDLAHNLIAQAQQQAETSGAIVNEAVAAMNAIDKSSDQMGQIIGVIDEIAFQTNLLALNAGVEAARAGEAGRGFAVVASEVRALAQRSAEAAKEIKVLIGNSSERVEQGVDLVGRTGEALSVIARSIGEITGIVSDIASGAKEQSNGVAEISIAINQMDRTTQQNAAMVEESTAATHALARETAELSKLIDVFDVGLSLPAQGSPVLAPRGQRPEPRRPTTLRKVANGRAVAEAPSDDWAEF